MLFGMVVFLGGEIVAAQGEIPCAEVSTVLWSCTFLTLANTRVMGLCILTQKRASHNQRHDGWDITAQQASTI